MAEHFLLRAVVNHLIMEKEPDLSSRVGKLYNDSIGIIRKDQMLNRLPVSTYDNSRIKREAWKMLLNDDKMDQFG